MHLTNQADLFEAHGFEEARDVVAVFGWHFTQDCASLLRMPHSRRSIAPQLWSARTP